MEFLKLISHKIQSFTKTIIFKNFGALMLLQVGNTLLALFIMPYLINVLGVGNYGLYSFALAISLYLVILTDYGFGFTGVKLISVNRDNPEKISSIFHGIQIIKIGLLLGILVLYTVSILFLDTLAVNKELYFLSFGILIGQTLVPVWFFQGMERMKFITIINLIIRVSAVILILIFVKKPEDINFAIAAQAISFTAAGILSIVLAYREFKLKFIIPKFSTISNLLVTSRHMFFSTLSLSLYKNFNVVLLGFLSTNVEVGIYAAAERIIKAVQSLIAPMSQAIYPNLSLKFSKLTAKESVKNLKRISTYYLLPLLLIILVLVIFKDTIVEILGIINVEFTLVYYVLIPVILFGSFNYLLGIVGLVNLNREKWFQKATIVGSLINFTLCLVLSAKYGATGSAIALTVAEFSVLIIVIRYLYKLSKFPK